LRGSAAGIAKVALVDFYTEFNNQITSPAQFALTNVTTPACADKGSVAATWGTCTDAFLAANNPVSSYTTSSYYSLHAFRFVNAANRSQLVRWAFVPQDGEKRLSDEELNAAPANFLEQRLLDRSQVGHLDARRLAVLRGSASAPSSHTWARARQGYIRECVNRKREWEAG
jgi:hypothetical protein